MTPKVLFWVQHLLGIGHVRRASAIVRAMSGSGMEVTVAMGGYPVKHIDWGNAKVIQLPAVQVRDETFKPMFDADGREIDAAWKARRARALMEAYQSVQPDAVMLELFPFGRRQFRFELLTLLEQARRDGCKIVSSVRDILVQKARPERTREMLDMARQWLDAVFVHGDPNVIAFEETFPPASDIRELIHYTGYVVQPLKTGAPSDAGRGEVIVSGGSGAVAKDLLPWVPDAPAHSRLLGERTWRVLTGESLPETVLADLKARAPANMIVEPNRGDFADLLANCAVSISLGGYNTTMDVLQSGARAVIAPFVALDENEQIYRTEWLAKRGYIAMIRPEELTAATLAAAADRVFTKQSRPEKMIDFDGSQKTANMLAKIITAADRDP